MFRLRRNATQPYFMENISYDDFKKLDMRIGTIRYVEIVPDSDKLLRCLVDFGSDIATMIHTDTEGREYHVRQIVSGIREYISDIELLVGKQVLYVVNLEPRIIKGVESQGMLMALSDENNPLVFLIPDKEVVSGSKIH